jgi:hypothetical protein
VAALILAVLLAAGSFVTGFGHSMAQGGASHHVINSDQGGPQNGTSGGGPPG